MLTQKDWIEAMGWKEYMAANAKLQAKKSKVRKVFAENVIKNDKQNTYDKYTYLSESGYKKLVNQNFTDAGLELTSSEVSYESYKAEGKMPYGVKSTWEFCITDTETGFSETTIVSGDGLDKGDKSIYKAATGALKYFMANNFCVATGDDAEAVSPGNMKNSEEIEEEEKAKANDIYGKLLVQVQAMKDAAADAGVDIHEPKTSEWLQKHTGVGDGIPTNVTQARKYLQALERLTNVKKQNGSIQA